MSKLGKFVLFVAILLGAFQLFVNGASASVQPRVRAYEWAAQQMGCPYTWGGTGPCGNGYDCSGLVMQAWKHAGVTLPRTTYEMLSSRHLQLIHWRKPKRGDLAFFGSGHVELVQWRYTTLGAPEPGESVRIEDWQGSDWRPTAFYRVH